MTVCSVWGCACQNNVRGSQRITCTSWSFHSTMWDLEIKFKLSGLEARTLTLQAISPVPAKLFKEGVGEERSDQV